MARGKGGDGSSAYRPFHPLDVHAAAYPRRIPPKAFKKRTLQSTMKPLFAVLRNEKLKEAGAELTPNGFCRDGKPLWKPRDPPDAGLLEKGERSFLTYTAAAKITRSANRPSRRALKPSLLEVAALRGRFKRHEPESIQPRPTSCRYHPNETALIDGAEALYRELAQQGRRSPPTFAAWSEAGATRSPLIPNKMSFTWRTSASSTPGTVVP